MYAQAHAEPSLSLVYDTINFRVQTMKDQIAHKDLEPTSRRA